jgi:hypothetical protein
LNCGLKSNADFSVRLHLQNQKNVRPRSPSPEIIVLAEIKSPVCCYCCLIEKRLCLDDLFTLEGCAAEDDDGCRVTKAHAKDLVSVGLREEGGIHKYCLNLDLLQDQSMRVLHGIAGSELYATTGAGGAAYQF